MIEFNTVIRIEFIIYIINSTIFIIRHIIENNGLKTVLSLLKGAGFLAPIQSSTSFTPTKFLSFTGLTDASF
jgi:hypothetical protein